MNEFKVTQVKQGTKEKMETKFFVNDVLVCICKVGSELYCSIEHGSPSNSRNRRAKAYYTNWKREGLRELLGEKYDRRDFRDSYPDTTWGSQGGIITLKAIKEKFSRF